MYFYVVETENSAGTSSRWDVELSQEAAMEVSLYFPFFFFFLFFPVVYFYVFDMGFRIFGGSRYGSESFLPISSFFSFPLFFHVVYFYVFEIGCQIVSMGVGFCLLFWRLLFPLCCFMSSKRNVEL